MEYYKGFAAIIMLVLSMLPMLLCHEIDTCESPITVNCTTDLTSPLISIHSINASTTFKSTFLENCNGHEGKCTTRNPNKECIQTTYNCVYSYETVVLKQSDTVQFTTSDVGFMLSSQGYLGGHYQKAQSVKCEMLGEDFRFMSMDVEILDFSPFISSEDYCFEVPETTAPPFCSGSGTIFKYYEFSPVTNINDNFWQQKLTMELKNGSLAQPDIRFLIKVFVPYPDKVHVTCTSGPGLAAYKFPGFSTPAGTVNKALLIITFVLGSLVLILITGMVYSLIVICRNKRKQEAQPQPTDHVYYTIDHYEANDGPADVGAPTPDTPGPAVNPEGQVQSPATPFNGTLPEPPSVLNWTSNDVYDGNARPPENVLSQPSKLDWTRNDVYGTRTEAGTEVETYSTAI